MRKLMFAILFIVTLAPAIMVMSSCNTGNADCSSCRLDTLAILKDYMKKKFRTQKAVTPKRDSLTVARQTLPEEHEGIFYPCDDNKKYTDNLDWAYKSIDDFGRENILLDPDGKEPLEGYYIEKSLLQKLLDGAGRECDAFKLYFGKPDAEKGYYTQFIFPAKKTGSNKFTAYADAGFAEQIKPITHSGILDIIKLCSDSLKNGGECKKIQP